MIRPQIFKLATQALKQELAGITGSDRALELFKSGFMDAVQEYGFGKTIIRDRSLVEKKAWKKGWDRGAAFYRRLKSVL